MRRNLSTCTHQYGSNISPLKCVAAFVSWSDDQLRPVVQCGSSHFIKQTTMRDCRKCKMYTAWSLCGINPKFETLLQPPMSGRACEKSYCRQSLFAASPARLVRGCRGIFLYSEKYRRTNGGPNALIEAARQYKRNVNIIQYVIVTAINTGIYWRERRWRCVRRNSFWYMIKALF